MQGAITNFGERSVLKNLFFALAAFGLLLGGLTPWLVAVATAAKMVSVWAAIFWAVAGVVAGLVAYGLVHLILLTKLKKLAAVTEALGQGDLSPTYTLDSNDVVGGIASGVHRVAENLRATITEINESASQLAEAAGRMSGITAETDQCMRKQQVQIDQVAAAMNEMTATVQEVARNAEQAAGATDEADQQAKSGALVATEAIGGIDRLATTVEQMGQVLEELRADSDNIGMVLDVIRGIAEQTNLLALNAAIEAARAGEQGRGFAVVADEVRTLASRTQKSTEEIHEMIARLQGKTGSVVKAMDEARARAQTGVDHVEKAAEALAEIAGSVGTIHAMNTQIASAVEQQRAVAEDISSNIVAISHDSEQTAAGSQQVHSSSEQFNELAARLHRVTDRFTH